MQDGDCVLLVADAGKEISQVERDVIAYLKTSGVPSVLALNKVDLYNRDVIAKTIAAYAALHDFDAVVPISAKNGRAVGEVVDELSHFLVESDWFYPDDISTDQPSRQYASEIIREKLLRTLDREVPHGIAVVIEEFTETRGLIRIRAEIYCEKATHKRIIVGKNGEQLKMVGTYAREELEKVFGKKVFLDLWVKVKENWRDSDGLVRNFGLSAQEDDKD